VLLLLKKPSRGLGVGTSPSALIAHGVHTTTIEIDPVVHKYATQYFNLPTNHTSIIGDAVIEVKTLQKTAKSRYDYIIHDVFTGGSEPLELFTEDFLLGLKNLLRSDGTIAIVSLPKDASQPMKQHPLNPPRTTQATSSSPPPPPS